MGPRLTGTGTAAMPGDFVRNALLAGAAAAVLAGAVALWLSTGSPGHAATAPQVQGTVVSVPG